MSNLLEKASIILTPTAYSDGTLHSVKPLQTLGSELVTNGDLQPIVIGLWKVVGVFQMVNFWELCLILQTLINQKFLKQERHMK